MEKKLIVRFRNQEDLDIFGGKFGVELTNLTNLVKEVTISKEGVKDIKYKKPTKPSGKPKKMDMYLKHWKDMPEFIIDFHKSDYAKIDFIFIDYTIEELADKFEQTVTNKTKSLWFPKLIQGEHRNIRVLGGRLAKYPIYVISKNRSEEYRFATSNWLSRMGQPHYIVVEPQDVEKYKASKLNTKYCTILEMDLAYKEHYDCISDLGNVNSTGPGAARNFCADHARFSGYDWAWILDDNSENFDRFWRGRRILSHSPETFRSVEEFVERYENIALAGLNYSKFCLGENVYPPFTINTRIYSYGLWNLNCPLITQRGRYNEDTIQSLDVLSNGWNTIQFNCYLGAKVTTQKIQGGNTEEFYNHDEGGTLPKSQMLVDAYPQYARLVWKFSRYHHEVDYSSFTQPLIIKDEYKHLLDEPINKVNENGAYIVRIPREMCLTDDDNRETLEKMFPRGCEEDITNSNLYL